MTSEKLQTARGWAYLAGTVAFIVVLIVKLSAR